MNIPATYHFWKDWIAEATGLQDPALHVHAGLIILTLARAITGRQLGSFVPFAFVVAAQAGNEIIDYLNKGGWADDTLSDCAYTLFWPLVISLIERLRTQRGAN